MKAQDRRGQICTISQLKYYYRNQYIYHLNNFHKNEGFYWLDFKLGGNYQIFQVSEPRLLYGRQILGIRISNLPDINFPKYFISPHTKKITKAKKEWKKLFNNQWSTLNQKWSSSLINYDVGCPLWPQQPQREGKSDEVPSGAKMRPNGKETAQLSPPSDQAILISLAFGLPRSISQLKSQNWRSSCQAQSHCQTSGWENTIWKHRISDCNNLLYNSITGLEFQYLEENIAKPGHPRCQI